MAKLAKLSFQSLPLSIPPDLSAAASFSLSRLTSTLTKNVPATPLDSALTSKATDKCFSFNTYKKHTGGGGGCPSFMPMSPQTAALGRFCDGLLVPRPVKYFHRMGDQLGHRVQRFDSALRASRQIHDQRAAANSSGSPRKHRPRSRTRPLWLPASNPAAPLRCRRWSPPHPPLRHQQAPSASLESWRSHRKQRGRKPPASPAPYSGRAPPGRKRLRPAPRRSNR